MNLEIAASHGECVVCFEPLCVKGASVMADGRRKPAGWFRKEYLPKRVCRHFLCRECAPTIKPKKCPVCHQDFAGTFDVPDPRVDATRWFHIIDSDQSGTVDKCELVDALKGMFSVDPRALEEVIEKNWNDWDADRNGTLNAEEFCGSLVPFLDESLDNLRKRASATLPKLEEQPAEWFKTWDEDGSGELDRWEIVRALIKTFPGLTDRDQRWLSGNFGEIWSMVDFDGSGTITLSEFITPGGLYETLLANFKF